MGKNLIESFKEKTKFVISCFNESKKKRYFTVKNFIFYWSEDSIEYILMVCWKDFHFKGNKIKYEVNSKTNKKSPI